VPEIVKKVFDEYSVQDAKLDGLTATYSKRTYCVQYRESDFNFVSRLMEEEGIYYFFQHADGKHKLVLADAIGAHVSYPGYAKIPFSALERTNRLEKEYVHEWRFEREVAAGQVRAGRLRLREAQAELLVKSSQKRRHGSRRFRGLRLPRRPMPRPGWATSTSVRAWRSPTPSSTGPGKSNARGPERGLPVRPDQPRPRRPEPRVPGAGADYELEYSEYEAMENPGARYACSFQALSSAQAFRRGGPRGGPSCRDRRPPWWSGRRATRSTPTSTAE